MRQGRRIVRFAALICAVVSVFAGVAAQAAPVQPLDTLTLVVPAASGGGFDLTAKAAKQALEAEGLVRHVDIVRFPGAGGLVGLSQFAARYRGRGDALMVGGLVMLGMGVRDEAAVTLRDVAPVARLTGEWNIIVAPTKSGLTSVAQIRDAMTRNTGSVRWSGGALAGPDQGLVWSIAGRLRLPLDEVTYYAKAGGRRVAESLIEGRSDLGVSGYAEFAPYIASGDLRVLAIAAPKRIAGIDAPTLREGGIDTTMMNWRGVFAASGLPADQQARLAEIIARMAVSRTWQASLREQHWTDTYLDADAFTQFIDREQNRWSNLIEPPTRDASFLTATDAWWRNPIVWLAAGLLSVIGLTLAMRRHRALPVAKLDEAPLAAEAVISIPSVDGISATTLVKDEIQQDFGAWNLTFAERDIAWFMLRGLPLKEIAGLRGTSERTVRQQAQAIYRKAGLEGRSDLAGRILERFI